MPAPLKNIRQALTPAGVGGLWRFWQSVSGVAVREIAAEADRPVHLALVGTEDQTRLLAARLALETPAPRDGARGPADVAPFLSHHADARAAPPGALLLDADALTEGEAPLAAALARLALAHPDRRLALARRIPAFRPAVVAQLIGEASWANAKLAAVSALPGVLPFAGALLPATAVGDMILLTRNQALLLLRVAAAYGREVDLRARAQELLPVVGGAFGWRALARELLGLVPGGVGVAVKGAVSYAGTYTVGKGAAIFYGTGHALPDARLRQLYRDSFKDALARVRQLVRGGKAAPDVPPVPGPPQE